MRDESHRLIAAIVAVAACYSRCDDPEKARHLANLEERMQSWFRAKGWSPPSGCWHPGRPRERDGSFPA